MMSSLVSIAVLAALQVVAPAQQQENPQIVAQALDRCMTTYAVRMTHTDATDDAIFAEATRQCAGLNARLKSLIITQVPQPKADEFISTLDAQAKPNFTKLLARIRSDRAAQGEK